MTSTIVVLSGGMDSTSLLAYYFTRSHQVTAVSINYGQRHHKELDAARNIAGYYGAEHLVVQLPGLAAVLAGSALTDPSVDVPAGHYAEQSMRATVVPNRNAILANIAVGVAVARKADIVALGIHAGDHFIYPDCRPVFLDQLNALVAVANEGFHTPRVEAPFVNASKTEVAALGDRLGAPLHLSWSCYQGGDIHCGGCGTCYERREAFRDAGVPDPTVYAATPTYATPEGV